MAERVVAECLRFRDAAAGAGKAVTLDAGRWDSGASSEAVEPVVPPSPSVFVVH